MSLNDLNVEKMCYNLRFQALKSVAINGKNSDPFEILLEVTSAWQPSASNYFYSPELV